MVNVVKDPFPKEIPKYPFPKKIRYTGKRTGLITKLPVQKGTPKLFVACIKVNAKIQVFVKLQI